LFFWYQTGNSQRISGLAQGQTDLHQTGISPGISCLVQVRIKIVLVAASQNPLCSFQLVPNGKFPGSFPFGAGQFDPAPNQKFSGNFPFGGAPGPPMILFRNFQGIPG
jgi:hypothetical protein